MHLAMRLHLAAAAKRVTKPSFKIPYGQNEPPAVPEDPDYEELANGSFKCLYCNRVLKTEAGIIKHVQDKHQ